ncbi:hypothetical protein IFM89_004221 [Coptis chinensis]|uniref:Uncharacterized protein n=1 Tax=Coptis chinensis TaxID=261450 RepID=A0A835I7R7_9MAGN|nr:hypothetical protein IFM89_004221 [Coptis chinensis]
MGIVWYLLGCKIAYPSEADGLGLQLLKVQDIIPICASIISQRLALYALEVGSEWVRDQVKDLVKNREHYLPLERVQFKVGKGQSTSGQSSRTNIQMILRCLLACTEAWSSPNTRKCQRWSRLCSYYLWRLSEADTEVDAGRLRKGLEELVRDWMVQ